MHAVLRTIRSSSENSIKFLGVGICLSFRFHGKLDRVDRVGPTEGVQAMAKYVVHGVISEISSLRTIVQVSLYCTLDLPLVAPWDLIAIDRLELKYHPCTTAAITKFDPIVACFEKTVYVR
jgi:hypothetical protein